MSLARLALVLSLSLVGLAADECAQDDGCGLFGCVSQPQPRTEPKRQPAKCAPTVAFLKPGRGTVTDVKVCTDSFFGVVSERTYVKIAATWPTRTTVWVVDTQGGCDAGDRWDVYEPQGPARCE